VSGTRSRWRWRRVAVAFALGVVGVVTLTLVLLHSADPATVARHDYRFAVPDGWSEAGGDADLFEVRITPDSSAGPEAVLVQQTRLSYDSAATPRRGPGEIAELLAAEDPAEYSGFDPAVRFAGRDVVHYRQRPATARPSSGTSCSSAPCRSASGAVPSPSPPRTSSVPADT